jgi:hypothetical protein
VRWAGAGRSSRSTAARIAEVPFTAFTNRRKTEHVTGRLVVRQVKRLQLAHETSSECSILTQPRVAPARRLAHAWSTRDDVGRQPRSPVPHSA